MKQSENRRCVNLGPPGAERRVATVEHSPDDKHCDDPHGLADDDKIMVATLDAAAANALQAGYPISAKAITRAARLLEKRTQSSTLATGDRGCPCLYTTPCKDNCTCVNWTSSAGCARCCTYGSLEQRTKNAERLASLPLSATASAWQPIATAPKDGTLVLLLIGPEEAREHPLEDTAEVSRTIGHNNLENDGEDKWEFAGWCWSHDHYTQGGGTPTGWMPLPAVPCEQNDISRQQQEKP